MKHLLVLLTLLALPVLATVGQSAEQGACNHPTVSLTYDGAPADLSTYTLETETTESTADFDAWVDKYTAPDKKLQIVLDGKTYKKFPVMEYSVRLNNLSSEETGIISDFQSLDFSRPIPANESVTLNVMHGSTCCAEDFLPVTIDLSADKTESFADTSGRSSNEWMPYLEMNFANSGYLFAIGWTGSWKATFENDGKNVNGQFGIDNTNFKLLPNESIIQPSMVIFKRDDMSRREFKTIVHQFVLENKCPRDSKGDVIPPILAVASGGGNKTPEMLQSILNFVTDNQIPFDTYWIDAGWYGAPHEDELFSNCGQFWAQYVGDWRVNTTTHPSGTLLPIANAVHKAGLKFLLWFEPERIESDAPILKEHPDFRNGNLLNLGNPEALQWIQDTVYGIIDLHKIDIYREDFNLDPGPIWEKMDTPDRVGISEVKHVTGLYKFLDDMRARFPDILQENCASGGRRMDINMVSRAHSYCRSDYYIGQKPGDSAFTLGQNATVNILPFIPFQGCEFNCVPVNDNYAAFSIISSGTVCTPSDFDGGILKREFSAEEIQWFKTVFDAANRMKPYFMGNFYPLTDEITTDDTIWCGWQFDRADMESGFALVFRRAGSTEDTQTFELGNIDADASYDLEFFDGTTKTVKGSEFQNWTVKLDDPRSFCLVFYKKK